MKKIFLTGDACEDWLIFSEPYLPPKGNSGGVKNLEKNRKTQIQKLPGGVSLLYRFLQKLLPGTQVVLDDYLESGKTVLGDSIQAIAEVSKINPGEDAIHVKKFHGFSIQKSRTQKVESKRGNFPREADLVIIDDVGNDLRHFNTAWLGNLDLIQTDFQILYKANWPLSENTLLSDLADKHGHRTIAVVNADDFREHGLAISRQLSWDKTVSDFLTEFPGSPQFEALRKCQSLIVRFGLEAVLYLYQKSTLPNTALPHPDYGCRLFYLPSKYEGQIRHEMKADMQGMTAAFVTAFTRKMLFPYSAVGEKSLSIHQPVEEIIFSSIVPGMYAAIQCLCCGYEADQKGRIDYPMNKIFGEEIISDRVKVVDVTSLMLPSASSTPASILNLLINSKALVDSVAYNYVIHGKSSFLDAVPSGDFKDLRSYDREEIEDYRGFKKMVSEYLKRLNDTKPMCYAVFGPPGAGKSFGIRQIIQSIGGNIELIERNIAQFESYHDLIKAFQISRDLSLKGKIPLVFFDEFDANKDGVKLGWLKYFLAPMQDGAFKDGESIHPLGKGIFVFAGGTAATFQQFSQAAHEKDHSGAYTDSALQFREAKGPDFISRLKGFINIKGINKLDVRDDLFSLRRAMVLRSYLLRFAGIKNKEEKIFIDGDLLRVLLELPIFSHGARSLEAIIAMSDLQDARSFTKANLPSANLLSLHIDYDLFQGMIQENYFPAEYVEELARKIHQSWLGKERNKKHVKETAISWEESAEETKESNRQQVVDYIRKLDALQYRIVPYSGEEGIRQFSEQEIESMARMEHSRWVIEKIVNGWTYGTPRHDGLKIHDCLMPYEALDEQTKDNDRDTIREIPVLLRGVGFKVVRKAGG